MKHRVLIRRMDDNRVVKQMDYDSERQAERAERGVNINLNHEEYFTEIEEVEE